MDDRWVGGRWDLSKFKDSKGETDWDAVSCAFWGGREQGWPWGKRRRGGAGGSWPSGTEEHSGERVDLAGCWPAWVWCSGCSA